MVCFVRKLSGMREERIEFRAYAEERAKMEEAAAREGQTLSAWLRLVALRAARIVGHASNRGEKTSD